MKDAAQNKRSLRERLGSIENLGVIIIMLIFILAVVIFSGSRFFTLNNITNLLRSVSVTGIIACAVTLVMITANIDLSLGWMLGLAACITGVHADNTFVGIALALAACTACGALNGLLVGGLKLNAFITTLGTMYVFRGITMMYTNGTLLTAAVNNPSLKFMGQGTLLSIPFPVWLFAAVAVIFWFLLKKTTFGSRIFAVGANPVSSRLSGVSSAKTIFAAYTLAGLMTGLAGVVFFAKVMSTQPYSGVGMEFDVLTAVVLGGTSVTGGKGNIWGTVLGVVFVGILANGFTLMGLSSNVQYVTQGIILLVAIRADVMKSGGLRA